MLATGSEQQIPTPQLQDPGDDRNLVSLLRRRVAAREPFAADSFIQEADVYSAAPADLVRDHAPGMDLSEGKEMAWYFFSPANYHEIPGARRRKRKVGGADAGGTCCWHPEAGKVPILSQDKKSIGAYKRKLSYVRKIKNPLGAAKPFRNKSLGWIMVEIGLEQQQADQQLVICKVYKSPRPRRDAEISTEACGVHGDDKPCPAPPPAAPSCDSQVTERETTTLGSDLHSPEVSRKPPLSIPPAFKHGTRSRPMGSSRSGVAIVKKALVAPVTVVMKFGGSLTRSADRMKEMAKLVCSFPDGGGESPVVVLSAMGNTTNNLLLAAGKALSCRPQEASEIHELAITKELHFRMVDDLGLHRSTASGSLDELENVFMAIAVMKELTSKTRDYLVSFGERMSTTIFCAYLNRLGEEARQEWESYAVNTCGRGGSDLTATTIGRDLGSREIQVWKDVDGVLTCDPNVCANVIPLPNLTFDEAAELGLFGAQSMQLAMEGGIPVIVKNLCNPQARGTEITKTRDMSKSILTSIVLKSNVTMLNIKSTRMLGQFRFLAKSFSLLENLDTLVDCVATSEGKISLIIVPSKMSSRELVQPELHNVVEELQNFAVVDQLQDRSVISLIGNTQMSPLILEKAFNVLHSTDVKVQMISRVSSEVIKISLVMDDSEAKHCVQALHSEFFEKSFVSEVQGAEKERPIPSTAPSSSCVKKLKSAGVPQVGPEQPSGVDDYPLPVGADIGCEFEVDEYHGGDRATGVLEAVQPEQQVPAEVAEGRSAPLSVLDETESGKPRMMDMNHSALDHDVEVINHRMFVGVDNDGVLDVDNYAIDIPMLIGVNDGGGYSTGFIADMPRAVEGSSRLGTEDEEVIETLLAEITPDELLRSSIGDKPCPVPAFDSCESELHVPEECQAAYCGLCMTKAMGL